jgi:hypothetical protein
MDDAQGLLCPACGYDVRGIESERCPECGIVIDRRELLRSPIPWEHRKELGKWRAYWRTVRLAMFRPGKLAAAVARPVEVAEARNFSRRTAWLAWTPFAFVTMWLWLASMKFRVIPFPPTSSRDKWRWIPGVNLRGDASPSLSSLTSWTQVEVGNPLSVGFALELVVMATLFASLLLWMIFLARSAVYFYHPPRLAGELRARATAISHYACAPLALLVLWTPLLVYCYWSKNVERVVGQALPEMDRWLRPAAYGVPMLLLGWSVACNVLMMRKSLHCGGGRLMFTAVALPVVWMIVTAVALSLPFIVLMLALMLLSVMG